MGGFGRVSLPARFGYFAVQQSNARRGSDKLAAVRTSRRAANWRQYKYCGLSRPRRGSGNLTAAQCHCATQKRALITTCSRSIEWHCV